MMKTSNPVKRPTPLKPGDILGVCAPSAQFDAEKLNRGIHVLKNQGFEVKIPEQVFERKRYLAGEDMLRASVVNRLFSDPDIGGIICARGGFGAMRILDHLDWKTIRQNPKPFIGFSDNTAILLSILGETGNPVIHGPTVVSLADAPEETLESFCKTLRGSLDDIHVTNSRIIRPGKCTGVLKGGNIATISHLSGTRFQPDFKNSVLFLEDIGEPDYKIDRMLTQMKMAGQFAGIRGVIIGSFEKCGNGEYLDEILFETFEEYNVPVLSDLSAGHGKVNLSLCMGTDIEMDTTTSTIHWN